MVVIRRAGIVLALVAQKHATPRDDSFPLALKPQGLALVQPGELSYGWLAIVRGVSFTCSTPAIRFIKNLLLSTRVLAT
jgi:hypothetical protein